MDRKGCPPNYNGGFCADYDVDCDACWEQWEQEYEDKEKTMEKPIKELTEDEVKEYRIIKAFLDAGGTIKKTKEGEGGVYLRGKKLNTEEVMDCIFNPTITNAGRIRSMTDEKLAVWIAETSNCSDWCILNEQCKIKPDYACCVNVWLDWLREEAKGESDE